MKHRFISGLVSAGGGYGMMKSGVQSKFVLVSANAVIGGTASELGGGKFANGAITGAFVILFNDLAHDEKEKEKRQRVSYKGKEFSATNVIMDGLDGAIADAKKIYKQVESMILPAAASISYSGDAQGGTSGSITPIGIVFIYRGNPGKYLYSSGTAGLGGVGGSTGLNFNTYYYTGDISDFSIDNILGESKTVSVSVDAGISVSANGSTASSPLGRTFSVGLNLGVGVGPTIFGGMAGQSYTKPYK